MLNGVEVEGIEFTHEIGKGIADLISLLAEHITRDILIISSFYGH